MSKARWINVCAGAWLFASAGILHPTRAALANQLVLGLAILLVAFLAMGVDRFRVINTALGMGAIVSPFLLGYESSAAAFNDVAVGLVVYAVSMWPGRRGLAGGRSATR